MKKIYQVFYMLKKYKIKEKIYIISWFLNTMIREHFKGRLDGEFAELINGYWAMSNIQISPKYGETSFEENILYKTNIKLEDITDSLSSPSSISIYRLLTFISFLESLGYSAIDFKMHLYDLIFLPLFIASMVLLASAIVMNLKQNDKFTKIIIYSFIIIFIIYFLSNLLDALGSTSQIHPLTSKLIMPLIVLFISIISFQFHEFKRKKLYDSIIKIQECLFYFLHFYCISLLSINKIQADQKVRIIADQIKSTANGKIIEADGNAVAINESGEKIITNKMTYNKETKELNADGNIIFNDIEKNTFFMDSLIAKMKWNT